MSNHCRQGFPAITEAPSCSVFNMDRTSRSGAQLRHEAPDCPELGADAISASLDLSAAHRVERCAGASQITSIDGDHCPNWLYSTKSLAGRYCPSCMSQRSQTLWDGRPVGTGSMTGSSGTSSVASG